MSFAVMDPTPDNSLCNGYGECHPEDCKAPVLQVQGGNGHSRRLFAQCSVYRQWAEGRKETVKASERRTGPRRRTR